MAAPQRYRIEHREAGQHVCLGIVAGDFPHHATLDPFVSHLLRQGHAGEVLLIDDDSGDVITRRRVSPYGTPAGKRFGDRRRRAGHGSAPVGDPSEPESNLASHSQV